MKAPLVGGDRSTQIVRALGSLNGIDGRAAAQQGMSLGGTAFILERAEEGISLAECSLDRT